MKLSCGEQLLKSVKGIEEKLKMLEECGFEGMEITGSNVRGREDEIKKAVAKSKVRASTICGYDGSLLAAEKGVRDNAVDEIKYLLSFAGEIGAMGVIIVPLFGPPEISNLYPYADAVTLEKRLLVELLKEIGEHARKVKAFVLLEPLNRYETHLINRLEQAVEIVQKVNNPYVKIMADLFHMNIEERDMSRSIQKAGRYIKHVHLADSTRLLPGYGHTDFRPSLRALKKLRFRDYMALECGIPPGSDAKEELKKCVKYLKDCMG